MLNRGVEGEHVYTIELLEQFHKLCSVLGVKKEASAVGEGDGLEGRFDRR